MTVWQSSLFQLKSVSHLQGAVLVYRVSVSWSWSCHVWIHSRKKQPSPILMSSLWVCTLPLIAHQGVNTLISDLCFIATFFSTSVSSSHHLSCFRDELLFFLYLYQRWYDTHTLLKTCKPSMLLLLAGLLALATIMISFVHISVFRVSFYPLSPPGVTPPRPGGESQEHTRS